MDCKGTYVIRSLAGFFCITFLLSAICSASAATVSGFVRGEENGEALSFTDVFIQGTTHGQIANTEGYYVITGLPAGKYTITFIHVGYKTRLEMVTLAEEDEIPLTVELTPQATEMETIEVRAGEDALGVRHRKLSLSTRDLTSIPAIVESDLMRSVQMLPGVSSLSDFSSGLYVRGGSADQNLILLDHADVYNPNHLFGFFSTFNVDAVKTVDLQKSAYPARYGGRLSALLDIHNRDGNRKEFEGTVRTSIIASAVTLEGPWKHGSWMLSGRHTYIEQLMKAMNIDLPYKFYDFHGKINYDLDENDFMSVSYYSGLDRLDWDIGANDILLQWGNNAVSGEWTHVFGSRLFSNFILGYSRFASRIGVSMQDLDFESKNEINDIFLKANATYAPSANHAVDFGIETKFLDFGFRQGFENEDNVDFSLNGSYWAVYGQENWKFSPLTRLEAGLRLNYYDNGNYFNVAPRLAVRRQLTGGFSTHVAYGRYNQYLNLISYEGASFADMWFPVDATLDPGTSDHYVVGFEFGPTSRFDLSIEGYFKPYRNVVEFSDEFGRSLAESDAKMGDAFNTGTGQAYGFDLFLKNRYAGFEGWLGYSYGETKRKIDNYNFDEEYYPEYDRRHQIVAMQNRNLGKNWNFNFAYRYGSGQPTTLAAGRYTVRDISGREYDTMLEGEKNAYRLPDYHRLDIGFSWKKKWRGMIIEPNIQVINALDNENVYIRTYDMETNPVEFEDLAMLPRMPNLGVRITF